MDPNQTLKEIRELVGVLSTQLASRDDRYALEVDVDTLLQKVRDLDGWLSRGGFLPKDWRTKR